MFERFNPFRRNRQEEAHEPIGQGRGKGGGQMEKNPAPKELSDLEKRLETMIEAWGGEFPVRNERMLFGFHVPTEATQEFETMLQAKGFQREGGVEALGVDPDSAHYTLTPNGTEGKEWMFRVNPNQE